MRYNPNQFEPIESNYDDDAYYDYEELEWECERAERLMEE